MPTKDSNTYFTSGGCEELSLHDAGDLCVGLACPCIVFGKNMAKTNEGHEQICCVSYWVLSGVSISVPLLGTSWAIVHTTINVPFWYLFGFPFIFPVPFCTAAQVLWAHGRLKIKKRMGVLTDEDNVFKELLDGGCCCGSCKVLEDARVLKNATLYDAVATEPTSNNMTRDNS